MDLLNISPSEKDVLMEFRNRVSDLDLKPFHDVIFLYRFLKAREFHVDKAEKMIRTHFAFRERWVLNEPAKWEPPEPLVKHFPLGFLGYDFEGCPVWISRGGTCDLRGLMNSVRKTDFIRHTLLRVENTVRLAHEQTKKLGKDVHTTVFIFDAEGFSLKQIASRNALDVLGYCLKSYEANFPETLKLAVVVNAPRTWNTAFSMMKPFFHPNSLKKIFMFGQDPKKWQSVLLQNIPEDILPKYYGGTAVDPLTGDPRCSSYNNPGGVVPKSLYFRRLKKGPIQDVTGMIQVTVSKGGSLRVPVQIAQSGSILRWRFGTRSHDLGFCVLRIEGEDEDGIEVEMLPRERVHCDTEAEEGAIVCPEEGTYVLEFDNRYSLLRSKKLLYKVDVELPTEGAPKEPIDIVETDLVSAPVKREEPNTIRHCEPKVPEGVYNRPLPTLTV